MAEVAISLRRSFVFDALAEDAYAFLTAIPRWARLFPHIDRIDAIAGEESAWQWTMEKLGPPGFEEVVVYGCRYSFHPETHTVEWEPVEGVGNARFSGSVRFAPRGEAACAGWLVLDAVLDLPVPVFVVGLVRPAVKADFGRMTDQFLDRLAGTVQSGGQADSEPG